MIYVNFTDSFGNTFIDNIGYEFLVKNNLIRVRNMTDVEELVNSNSIKCSFYFYHLYDDESVRKDLSPYVLEDGDITISNNNGV